MNKQNIILISCIIIASTIVFYGCKELNKNGVDSQVSIMLDSALIGNYYFDSLSKISYAPPKEWEIVNDSLKQLVFTSLGAELKTLEIALDAIYVDSLFHNIMTISYLNPNKNYDSLYKKAYFKNSTWKENEYVRFSNNGLRLTQFSISDNKRNYFKILLQNTEEEYLTQIDYILSKQYIDSIKMRKIESSIASFHLSTN